MNESKFKFREFNSFNLNFKYLISLQTEEIETRDREGLAGRVV